MERNTFNRPVGTKTRNKAAKYEISRDKYLRMLDEQGNKCKLCGEKESIIRKNGFKKLSIDHCHETNYVRGLLCQKCNTGLGMFREDINLLQKAIEYIKEGQIKGQEYKAKKEQHLIKCKEVKPENYLSRDGVIKV
jgi:hypothetical protein